MSIPTCEVQYRIIDQTGVPVEGAVVEAVQDRTDRYEGLVVPVREYKSVADADGSGSMHLFRNALGSEGSRFRIRVRGPDGRTHLAPTMATVPDEETVDLYTILDLQPPPTLSEAELAEQAAQGYAAAALGHRQQTEADALQTGEDRQATGADRVQTGLDAEATAADRVQTGLDAEATAADRVQTGQDAEATAADREAIENNFFVYVDDDDQSVTLTIGEFVLVDEGEEPYEHITIEIGAAA